MSDRCFGIYRGVVENNVDPDNQKRVRVRVAGLPGCSPCVWALPCVSPCSRALPEVGQVIWVAFEQGDIEMPVWMGTFGRFPDDD